MRQVVLAGLAAMLLLVPVRKTEALTVFDPTNYNANLETKIQMVQQVINSAKQIENQIKDMQSLDWENLKTAERECVFLYRQLEEIHRQGEAAYESWLSTDEDYKEASPDYEKVSLANNEMYERQIQKGRERWEKTLKQALRMAGVSSTEDNRRTCDEVLSAIEASNNSKGTVQALQAASQLNGIMIGQLQKLQNMMSESIKLEAAAAQRQLDEKKRAEDYARRQVEYNKKFFDKDARLKRTGKGVDDFHYRDSSSN